MELDKNYAKSIEVNGNTREYIEGSVNDEFQKNYTKKIVVFGDIHGNLEGLVNTVRHLEKKLDERLPLVFQVGDFGYFKDEKRLLKDLRNDK